MPQRLLYVLFACETHLKLGKTWEERCTAAVRLRRQQVVEWLNSDRTKKFKPIESVKNALRSAQPKPGSKPKSKKPQSEPAPGSEQELDSEQEPEPEEPEPVQNGDVSVPAPFSFLKELESLGGGKLPPVPTVEVWVLRCDRVHTE